MIRCHYCKMRRDFLIADSECKPAPFRCHYFVSAGRRSPNATIPEKAVLPSVRLPASIFAEHGYVRFHTDCVFAYGTGGS